MACATELLSPSYRSAKQSTEGMPQDPDLSVARISSRYESCEFLRGGNPAAARNPNRPTQLRVRTSAAIPQSKSSTPDGSGTVGAPSTSTLNVAVPNTSNVFPSVPPRTWKIFGPTVPGAAVGLIWMAKMSNGPLLTPGSRKNGALIKKSVSSSASVGTETEKLSPFRSMVSSVSLVIVPTASTVLPAVPEIVETVTSTLSARDDVPSIKRNAPAMTASTPRYFILFTSN